MILSIALLFGISTSFANAGEISLPGGGTIGPRQTVKISGAPLVQEVNYDVTCDLTNPNQDPIGMNSSMWSYVDGDNSQASYTHLVRSGATKFHGPYYRYDPTYHPTIDFTNLDSTQSIQVQNCVAKLHVG